MRSRADMYRMGPYEIRVRTRELYKAGTRLKLRPQPFLVLQVLLDRAGDVVTREELRTLLWPAETFVDFEHGLNTSVAELRRVLRDSASEPRYIETLPKLGYRIVAPVEMEPLEAPAPVPNPPRQQAMPLQHVWLLASVILTLAVLGGWIAIRRKPISENSIPQPLTSFPGAEQSATWSADGSQLAFAWDGGTPDRSDIYLLQPGSSRTVRLTAERDAESPSWSPDGKWIAYVDLERPRGTLKLVSPLGGPARPILSSQAGVSKASWFPDGKTFALAVKPEPQQSSVLWTVSAESGQHRALSTPPAGIPGDTAPAVSPDGRTVVFCRSTAWRTSELYLLDLKPDESPAGPPRRITDLGWVSRPAWTPDGARIVFESTCQGAGLCQIDRRGQNLEPVFGAPEGASQPALTRRADGHTSLAFTNFILETAIWRYATGPESGSPPVELAPSTRSQRDPRYSPDGTRLAFASDRAGFEEIWASDADGSQPMRLTDLKHILTEAPDWSPSGGEIAFVTQDRAQRQIYVVSASGGPARVITHVEGILSGDGWTRDGSGYYFTARHSGRAEVWKAPKSGGRPEQITRNGGECGFESAKGVFYYWRGSGNQPGDLMRRMPDGDHPVVLIPPGQRCSTAPSPRGFYFKSADNDVFLYDEATDRSERAFEHPAENFNRYTVSPDGHWLTTDRRGRLSGDLMIMERFR